MNRNVKALVASRIIRSFSFGYLSFIIPLYLKSIGFNPVLIGLYFMINAISSSLLVLAAGFLGDLYGRRDTLIAMSSLFTASMLVYSTTVNRLAIFATSILGTTGGGGPGGGAGGGPVTPLQTSLLADNTSPVERTRVYSITTAASTASSLAGAASSYLFLSMGLGDLFLFRLSAVLSALSLLVLLMVSRDKGRIRVDSISQIIPRRSSGSVVKIAIAGSLGSLGLGMVTPLLPLWFKLYLHATELDVNMIYMASYLVSMVSTLLADRVERVMGRVKAISVLRAVSVGLFIVMAVTPSLIIDSVLYIIRVALYMVTIPMRQSLSMEVITSDERARGLSITGLARRLPYSLGSFIAGVMMNSALFALSMITGGLVSMLDPLLYYIFFRSLGVRSRDRVND
ncbi:MFS transporter [Caldivirga maquilingensis]|uniref:Major facilitator superfamily MFS_1 n=1 Tax=Caldivirga maquilingensis (strain ATCC 700844 / DSM 13496 / JCM 10307 / IC-167) TaxID=397948 RepID=A8MCR6_CALMQ|nr:MFS transporter [Caldivirga maquilingensis]ABW01572.1 major facilitator superfamily MFS_1 [Caldivirga maquilingensis IC-167]